MNLIFILLGLISFSNAENIHVKKGVKHLESKNYIKAVEEFSIASEEGSKLGTLNLAVMYENGYGVKRDKEKASKLIETIPQSAVISD